MPISLNAILNVPTREEKFRRRENELDREHQVNLLRMRPELLGEELAVSEPFEINRDQRQLAKERELEGIRQEGAFGRMREATNLRAEELRQNRADETAREIDAENRAISDVASAMFPGRLDALAKATDVVKSAKSSGLLKQFLEGQRTQGALPLAQTRGAAEEAAATQVAETTRQIGRLQAKETEGRIPGAYAAGQVAQEAEVSEAGARKSEADNRATRARIQFGGLLAEAGSEQRARIAENLAATAEAQNVQTAASTMAPMVETLTQLKAQREKILLDPALTEAQKSAQLSDIEAKQAEAAAMIEYIQKNVMGNPMEGRLMFTRRAPAPMESFGGNPLTAPAAAAPRAAGEPDWQGILQSLGNSAPRIKLD